MFGGETKRAAKNKAKGWGYTQRSRKSTPEALVVSLNLLTEEVKGKEVT